MKYLKKYLLKGLYVAFMLTLVVGIVEAAGNKKTIPTQIGISPVKGPAIAAKTSYVDTVIINVDPTASAAAFALHTKDSTSIVSAVLHRVIDGTWMKTVASADTLSGFTSYADTCKTGNNGCSVTSAITLAPLCDQYYIIITFNSSGVGTTAADTLAYPMYIKTFGK